MTDQINPSGLIEEVVTEVPQVISGVSTAINSTKTIILLLIIGGFLFFKGCSCFPKIQVPIKIAPTKINSVNSNKPVVTTDTTVTYYPNPTKQNPNPKAITVSKPVEGKVSVANGSITIQNSGFRVVPKIGAVYVLGETIEPVVGARFFFAGDFGLEGMINIQHMFLGIDARDPLFNTLTTSLGICNSYQNLLGIKPYLGEEVTLLIF